MSYFEKIHEQELSKVCKSDYNIGVEGIQLTMNNMKGMSDNSAEKMIERVYLCDEYAYSDPGCSYYDFEEVNYVDILRRSKSADLF